MAASSSAEIETPYSLLTLSFNAFLEHKRAKQHQYIVEDKKPAPGLLEDLIPLMPLSSTSSPNTPAGPVLLKNFLNPVTPLVSEGDLMNHLQKFAGLQSWLQTQPHNPSTFGLIQIFDSLDTQNKEHLLTTLKRYLMEHTEIAIKFQQDATSLLLSALNAPSALANAAFIFKLDSVSNLNLRFKPIGAKGATLIAQALTTNSTLTSLFLWANHISVEGARLIARALTTNSTLTSLSLGYNPICDKGVKRIAQALSTNSTLTSLDLGDNRIGIGGAKPIANTLEKNSTLTSLVLGGNSITDKSVKLIAQALSTNSTLTSLELSGNDISSEILQQIETLLERNRKNNVQRNFSLMGALSNIVNKPLAPGKKSLVDSFLEESVVIEETNNDADSSSEMKARGPQSCR